MRRGRYLEGYRCQQIVYIVTVGGVECREGETREERNLADKRSFVESEDGGV
jgi:hypothetical protein